MALESTATTQYQTPFVCRQYDMMNMCDTTDGNYVRGAAIITGNTIVRVRLNQ